MNIQTCPRCKGKKKQILKISELNKPVKKVKINCITCKGEGQVPKKIVQAYQNAIKAWCKCGNPSGEAKYWPDNTNPNCNKHCWTCEDCNKIVQVG